jgi:hypothetical protein
MLITEPMVTCIALYASFVYALLYMTLEVFPIVFQENRGFGPVVGSLPFLGLLVGVCSAMVVNLSNQPRYARIVDAAGGKPVPEARCAPMAIGGIVFAIGLFWFGWTADPSIQCMFSLIYERQSQPMRYDTEIMYRDCAGASGCLYWCRFQYHLSTVYQLFSRYISTIRCKRSVWKYLPAKHSCSRLPAGSNSHVP